MASMHRADYVKWVKDHPIVVAVVVTAFMTFWVTLAVCRMVMT